MTLISCKAIINNEKDRLEYPSACPFFEVYVVFLLIRRDVVANTLIPTQSLRMALAIGRSTRG